MSEKTRCKWATGGNELYLDYHDHEWGVAQHDDRVLFEFLILEGAQAGLSWSTILNKREGYRKAFSGFDPHEVARYDKARINKLLRDPAIVRNRLKVESAVINARAFLDVQEVFGSFDTYIWRFTGGKVIQNSWKAMKQVPAGTKISDAMSKDLKSRGFKFVGTTIMYAHMQATGMVNDHTVNCFRWKQLQGRGTKIGEGVKGE